MENGQKIHGPCSRFTDFFLPFAGFAGFALRAFTFRAGPLLENRRLPEATCNLLELHLIINAVSAFKMYGADTAPLVMTDEYFYHRFIISLSTAVSWKYQRACNLSNENFPSWLSIRVKRRCLGDVSFVCRFEICHDMLDRSKIGASRRIFRHLENLKAQCTCSGKIWKHRCTGCP